MADRWPGRSWQARVCSWRPTPLTADADLARAAPAPTAAGAACARRLLLHGSAATVGKRRRLPRHQRPAARRSAGARRRHAGHRRAAGTFGSAAQPLERASPARPTPSQRHRCPTSASATAAVAAAAAGASAPTSAWSRRAPACTVRRACSRQRRALDDVVRDLRLSPVLQLGVSYSF